MTSLSTDLQVACEIYRLNKAGENAWFSKLVEIMPLDKLTISRALDTLTDWMIIYGEYGPSTPGHATYLYFIDEHHEIKIAELYNNYYKTGD